jgi:lysine 2,3-aminomutase
MYCRHCTRKRLWKQKSFEPSEKEIDAALAYVREHKEIREVVVSGGDPLTLCTEKLDYILSAVSRVENVEVVRLGTRTPVVMPERVDEELCETLGKYEKLWINVQFNHPREITQQSTEACRKIQKQGIPMSNQSVLLKGVNDDPETMKELCQKLQSIRVRPYYLFQCDPVSGAEHFRTSVWRGVEIIEKLRGHTSGMCVPTFVIDGIDGHGKIPIGPNYMVSMSPEGVTLRNYNFETFFYHDPKE